MGRRRGQTGAHGAVVSSLSSASGGVVKSKNTTTPSSEVDKPHDCWIGKTPKNFLDEWCQKYNRKRPSYYEVADGKFKCVIHGGKKKLAVKVNCPPRPLYRGIDVFDFEKPITAVGLKPGEDHAALACLHICEYGKPLHRVLAPQFRDDWLDMDKAAQDDQKNSAIREEKQNIAKEMEEKRKISQKKRDQNEAKVALTEQERIKVEKTILELKSQDQNQGNVLASLTSIKTTVKSKELKIELNTDQILQSLTSMGFFKVDAFIALTATAKFSTQCESYELRKAHEAEALDWLCLNLDESELPPGMAPKKDIQIMRMDAPGSKSNWENILRKYERWADWMAVSLYSVKKYVEEAKAISQESELEDEDILRLVFENSTGIPYSKECCSTIDCTVDELDNFLDKELEALGHIYGSDIEVHRGIDRLSNSLWSAKIDISSCLWLKEYIRKTSSKRENTTRTELPKVQLAVAYVDNLSLPVLWIMPDPVIPTHLRRAVIRSLAFEVYDPDKKMNSDDIRPIFHDVVSFLIHSTEDDVINKNLEHAFKKFSLEDNRIPMQEKVETQTFDVATSTLRNLTTNNTISSKKLNKQFIKKMLVPKQTSKYLKILETRQKLPIWNQREEIINTIDRNPVVIIAAATGSGKTTQVPQFIIESLCTFNQNSGITAGFVNVYVTQPRRLAAISVAERIADERDEMIGQTVGFQVRMNSKVSKETALVFCTTGVLLRKLSLDEDISSITHVVVDEVHQRDADTDFLLIKLRRLLEKRNIRVILMSATVDSEKFASYFSSALKINVPIIEVPGRTFPVKIVFLKDIMQMTKYRVNAGSKYALKREEQQKFIRNEKSSELDENINILNQDCVNVDLVVELITFIHEKHDMGSILVFLPGISDIDSISSRLSAIDDLFVLTLHGAMSGNEQSRVFESAPDGLRKVVLSTNIAETSITIEDIVYVIDTCRVKEQQYDSLNNVSKLVETSVSKSSAQQRSGRAGRVRAGICYRLVTEERFSDLANSMLPEILRSSLDQVVLQSLPVPWDVLSEAIDPPKEEDVALTAEQLVNMGALLSKESKSSYELSALGRHLVGLPLDVTLGKMLIYACIFSCLDPILSIAATILEKSPFFFSGKDREKYRTKKKELAGNCRSDLLLYARVYKEWEKVCKKGRQMERKFLLDNHLDRLALQRIQATRTELTFSLENIGFLDRSDDWKSKKNQNSESNIMLQSVIFAGLYPCVVRIESPLKKYSKVQKGAVILDDESSGNNSAGLIHYRDRYGKRMFLDPNSINFDVSVYEHPWLAYREKFQMPHMDKLFLRDSTMVPSRAVLMFAGRRSRGQANEINDSIEVFHETGKLLLDKWMQFDAPARISVLVRELRKALDNVLITKIEDPSFDESRVIGINAIYDFLCNKST